MYWVGAHTYDGKGNGTGWVTVNAGGGEIHGKLVGFSYAMHSDCSVQLSFSLQVQETGTTIGPFQRVAVVAPTPHHPWALDLNMIFGGSQPGNDPVPCFDGAVAHRVSMRY